MVDETVTILEDALEATLAEETAVVRKVELNVVDAVNHVIVKKEEVHAQAHTITQNAIHRVLQAEKVPVLL